MANQQPILNTSWLPVIKAAQEEQDLDLAAELAISDENPIQESPQKPTLGPIDAKDPERLLGESASNIRDMIEETRKLNASIVPLVSDPGGDTWVFISPPAQNESDAKQYRMICEHFAIPHCFKSETLKSLNSSAFCDWFSYTPQHRILRRRGLVGKLPHNIKYVIDLTPQVAEDEGAHLLTELMCPDGIRTWVLAMGRWDIPSYLAGGSEDYALFDTHKRNATDDQAQSVPSGRSELLLHGPGCTLDFNEIRVVRRARTLATDPSHVVDANFREVEYIIPPCYTSIRHYCAIERVLNIIDKQGNPKLDSAPKVWTTFIMAKHLGVAHYDPFPNYIVSWLRANRNSVFIDVMPEFCLAMADGIQNYVLCQEAFAILLGERALESAQAAPTSFNGGSARRSPVTVHGRRKYDVPEAYETRLEYAYTGFREMVFGQYAMLIKGDWISGLDEYQRLSNFSFNDVAYQTDLRVLRRLLHEYVRGSIMFALRAKSGAIGGPYGDCSESDDIFPTTKFANIWEGLSLQQRLLTRSFWTLLGSLDLPFSVSNNEMTAGKLWGEQVATCGSHLGELDGESPVKGATTKAELDEALNNCKFKLVVAKILDKRQAWKEGETMYGNFRAWSKVEPVPVNKNRWRYRTSSGGSKASTDQAAPTEVSSTLRASGRPRVKRPKMEPLDKDEAEPLLGMFPSTPLNIPLRPHLPPKDPPWVFEPSWDQPTPVSSNQPLDPPHHDAKHIDTTPAVPQWREVVDAEDVARARVAFRELEYDRTLIEKSNDAFGSSSSVQLNNMETPFTAQGKVDDFKDSWEDFAEHYHVDFENRFFDLSEFLKQANSYIRRLCARMLVLKDTEHIGRHELCISDVLCCATDNEYKYLPLWAGGNDDGSGGVFDDEIPIPDAQFTTAGPKVFSSGNSSAASSSSDFDMVSRGGSTKNTSTIVFDGFSDTLDRHRTYAASEVSDSPSTVGRLASQLGEYDMLSDFTAEEHPCHGEEQVSHDLYQASQMDGAFGPDIGTKPSAAMGKARADPEESYDDVFDCLDTEGDGTESEGEDQVFEDD